MPISSFNALAEHALFKSLHRAQSQYDNEDPSFLNGRFTRSPYHAIQFLVTYVGLSLEQRSQVILRLNIPDITLDNLNELINEMDWSALLVKSEWENLVFKFKMQLPSKGVFLQAMQVNCPSLHAMLLSGNSIIEINEVPTPRRKIIFETIISQTELWRKPFECLGSYWKVPEFILSRELKRKIDRMRAGGSCQMGGFSIFKGDLPAIQLHILQPKDKYKIAELNTVKNGIYDAFIGLENFYGITVDEITVEIKSDAEFSRLGAFVSQSQQTTFAEKGGISFQLRQPTVIRVTSLHALFHGVDIVANFANEITRSSQFDNTMYIELIPSAANKGIYLLPEAPTPLEAYSLISSLSVEASNPAPAAGAAGFFRGLNLRLGAMKDNIAPQCSIS